MDMRMVMMVIDMLLLLLINIMEMNTTCGFTHSVQQGQPSYLVSSHSPV